MLWVGLASRRLQYSHYYIIRRIQQKTRAYTQLALKLKIECIWTNSAMDLYNIEHRLMILECLRENSSNMRIEQENLRERISQALVRARTSLMCIRQLNIELQEMKVTVENALATDLQIIEEIVEPELVEDTDKDTSAQASIAQEQIKDNIAKEKECDVMRVSNCEESKDAIDKQ